MVAIRITDPDNPYRNTGKTCLGGGMHCPSASSCLNVLRLNLIYVFTVCKLVYIVCVCVRACVYGQL